MGKRRFLLLEHTEANSQTLRIAIEYVNRSLNNLHYAVVAARIYSRQRLELVKVFLKLKVKSLNVESIFHFSISFFYNHAFEKKSEKSPPLSRIQKFALPSGN